MPPSIVSNNRVTETTKLGDSIRTLAIEYSEYDEVEAHSENLVRTFVAKLSWPEITDSAPPSKSQLAPFVSSSDGVRTRRILSVP